MSSDVEADRVRARATSIRRLATTVDGAAASRLWQRAGADTWIGPTPARCLDELRVIRSSLLIAHDELLAAAAALERRAEALAATATTTRIAVT